MKACAYLGDTQGEDGAWTLPPEPRVLENALILLTAGQHASLRPACDRARAWLRNAPTQTHHLIPALLDRWMLDVANGHRRALDLRDPSFGEPAFKHRKLFFNVLALHWGCPVLGGASRGDLVSLLAEKLASRGAAQMKAWSAAELASLLLLLCDPAELSAAVSADALEVIYGAQTGCGSVALNPISTAVAAAALHRWVPHSPQLARALASVARDQQADGTWRFSAAEGWDTALLLRAFGGCELFPDRIKERARAFLTRTQNTDGGWPYRAGVESDTDTTGMTMLALAPAVSAEVATAACQYLQRMQTEEGLWRTWHYRDDPPAEDVVAHALLGLQRLGSSGIDTERAKRWLESKLQANQGWQAHWYKIRSYGAHEVGMALGRQHPDTRYVARRTLETQHPNGGWAPDDGATTTAAATGMAVALIAQYVPADHPALQRGLEYLLSEQSVSGAWVGPTDMYAPRPFAVDYPFQTHALAAMGVLAVHEKLTRPRTERRRGPRVGDYLAVRFRPR